MSENVAGRDGIHFDGCDADAQFLCSRIGKIDDTSTDERTAVRHFDDDRTTVGRIDDTQQ